MSNSVIFDNDDLGDVMVATVMWAAAFFVVNTSFALAFLVLDAVLG